MKLNLWEVLVFVMLATKGHSSKTMLTLSTVQSVNQNGVTIT